MKAIRTKQVFLCYLIGKEVIMVNLSLRNVARHLGSDRVSGMAQKTGLHWPPPPAISVRHLLTFAGTALVLSGGGAKGSFEIGVLRYLYYNIGFRPSIICSTSVGSVNALKLAEGEGSQYQGFQGLEKIWLDMKYNSDMYVEDSWFYNTPTWIKEAISGAGPNLDLFQKIFLLISGGTAEMLSDLKDFADTFKIAHGIYNLQPIEDMARQKVSFQLLGNIRLRMATVGLQSGAIRYITEFGRLVDDPALPSDDFHSPQVDIVRGMIASAAIPLFFEMQNLAGDWYVDGGLRQVAPIEAAIAMGATEVYAVVAPTPLAPETDFTHKGLVDIGTRAATDITIDQILTDNIAPFGGWGIPVHIFRPNIEVEPSRTIDPGLIRINMAYGFMRAFDVLSKRAADVKAALIRLSDQIASTRLQIWTKEEDALLRWGIMTSEVSDPNSDGNPDPLTVLLFSNDVGDMRALKNSLLGLVECRLSIAGQESVPPDATYWAVSWEAHQWDPANLPGSELNLPNSPWDRIIMYGAVDIPAAVPQATPPPGGCPQFPP
jgi:predicted acylesterase/phospholipase RssA